MKTTTLAEAVETIVGDLCRGDDGRFTGCGTGGGAGDDGTKTSIVGRADASTAVQVEAVAIAKRKADVLAAATTENERKHADLIARYAVLADAALEKGDSRSVFAQQVGEAGGFATYRWTPERQAIHKRIIEKALEGAEPSAQPTIVFMGGLPASGKTTAVGTDLRLSGRVVVNADDVKAELPEYAGSNAAYLHEESAEISEAILDAARAEKLDVVFDATMKTYKGAVARIEQFRAAGYRVECRFVDVDIDTSVSRAVGRLVSGHAKNGQGRYVPLEVIRSSKVDGFSSKPKQTFERLKSEGKFDAYVVADNRGATAVVRERYGKLTETAAWAGWLSSLAE